MRDRSRRLWQCVTLVGLIAASVLLVTSPASASDNGQWAVAPTGSNGVTPRDYFEYQLRPGQTLRDMVSVSNVTDHDMTFKMYPADAYDTPSDAAFALKLQTDEQTDAGSWIKLGYDTLTVPANSRADLVFEINVPTDASPGDHTAGILAEDASPPDPGQQTGVAIQRRVGTRVYIRVQGPMNPQLTVTEIGLKKKQALFPPFSGTGNLDVGYIVTNTGNIRMSGAKATLKLKGLFGRTLKTLAPADLPEMLPGATFVVNTPMGSLPIIDRLTVEVTIDAPGFKSTRSKAVWDIPWLEVLIVLVIVTAVFGRRRYRDWRANRPEKPDPPSEPDSVDKEPALV